MLVVLQEAIGYHLIIQEAKLKTAEQGMGSLIESAKNMDNFLKHIEEHASDSELTDEEVSELEPKKGIVNG